MADVHVAAYERAGGDRGLAAHLVLAPGSAPTDAELRAHTGAVLPAHAVPTAWSRLERLPLTPNGKVDARALPTPVAGAGRPAAAVAPTGRRAAAGATDALERRLTSIWERALDLDALGLDDDFFDLGGHSLLAVEVFDRIEREFGRRLPLATIFEASTVRRLAAALREDGWAQPRRSLVPITTTGRRPPLFFVAAGDGNAVGFGALARRLGSDQPFCALQPRGINGGAPLQRTVERMAAHYVNAITRVQRRGPFLLGGRCLGAFAAYEMARLLEARGERVALLAILDSSGPRWQRRALADGTPYDELMNTAQWRPEALASAPREVFSAAGTARLLQWLAEPVLAGADGTEVNRYLLEAYRLRPDVRDAYPDLAGPDATRLAEWAWRSGRTELGLYEPLLPPPPPETFAVRLPRGRPTLLHGGASLAATFASRAREAADLATGERMRGAVRRRSERVRAAGTRAATAYRAGPYGGVVTLIRSEEHRVQTLLDYWHGVESAGVVERQVPGTHRSMMREPDVAAVADCLRELVEEVCDRPGDGR